LYKEAAVGIKMVISHTRNPEVKLDQTQIGMIQAKLLVAVGANPLRQPLQFLYSKFAQGVFWITCANESSQAWLMRAVSELWELYEGMQLTAVDSIDLPKRPRVYVRIPDAFEVTTVLTRLRDQNPGINTTDWTTMSHKINERGQTLALSIDPDSFKTLTSLNFKAFWALGRVLF
jgi:hypothetical protein